MTSVKKNFWADNKKLIVISAGILATGIGLALWYRHRRRKKGKAVANVLSATKRRPVGFRCTSKSYPLEFGTCHPDVKILQRYLKQTFKENLGRTGRNRDGIDGQFGNLTRNAARKRLGKESFTFADIQGMKRALKSVIK